jgi:hypothetical protein
VESVIWSRSIDALGDRDYAKAVIARGVLGEFRSGHLHFGDGARRSTLSR